jgi:hypothetical protein
MLFIKRLFILFLFIPSLLFARGYDEDYDYSGGLKLAANIDFYQLEPVIGWRINKSFHVNCGLRIQTIFRGYPSIHASDYAWDIDDDSKIYKLFITPSLHYKLCLAERKKEGSTGYFNLFVEPGMLFQPFALDYFHFVRNRFNSNIPTESRRISNFKWSNLFFNCQSGLEYIVDDISLFFGYEISNQDIYISRRNVVVEDISLNDFLPKRKLCHSIFIGIRVYL